MFLSMDADNIVVCCLTEHLSTQAKLLAKRLQCPFAASFPTDSQFYLLLTEQRLELWRFGCRQPIYVDFLHGRLKYRRFYGGGQQQLIARACGLKKSVKMKIVDLTAGWGRDAFTLASLGHEVTMVERSKVIAALLEDGLVRLQADPVSSKGIQLKLQQGEALQWLQTLDEQDRPDIIYLDPMFPLQKKSALVKKEMQWLQLILGIDEDSEQLLQKSLSIAKKRIVVKRPKLAHPLGCQPPEICYKGRSTRFDVYTPNLSVKT